MAVRFGEHRLAGAVMALLVGTHVNRIDKKGRVSVPKPFRDFLAQRGDAGLYAYPSFKVPSIIACDEQKMQRLNSGLEDMGMFSDDQDDLAYIVMENARFLPFDPEGRIVLPKEHLRHAGITDTALFAGQGSQMNIWQPDAHGDNMAQVFERARARGVVLPLGPTSPKDGSS
jgi:MraZ protein